MSSKKKVLMLTWEFPPHIVGGLSRHVYGLAKELAILGWEIHVITAKKDAEPDCEILEGVYVWRVAPLNDGEDDFLLWIAGLNLAMAEKAFALAENNHFSLVHAHDWIVGTAAFCVKEFLQIPLIATIHATEYGRNKGIYTELQRFIHAKECALAEQSDHVIVCSNSMKGEIKKIFPVAEKKISVIPNGVEKKIPVNNKSSLFPDLPLDENRKLIFTLGRMVAEKGFDILIEAAGKMREKGLDVYFIIAGSGPLLNYYKQMVQALSLQNTVYLIGFIDDFVRTILLEKCYMAVFPSRYEPFGIAALEAMIAAKPVIAANVGGLKEIIRHGKTGLLMEPDNPESFMELAGFLLKNETEAKRMGERGKKYVEFFFSWKRAADSTDKVYKRFVR